MDHEIISGPFRLADGTVLPLSKAVRAGSLVFLSGQLGVNESGALVSADMAGQATQALENIRSLLASAGCTMSQVCKASAWIASPGHFTEFNRVYAAAFPTSPPVRTTVCSALLLPGALVEIEVVAYAP